MHKLFTILPAVLLAACAANRPDVAVTAAPQLTDTSASLTNANTEVVEAGELDNGMVCERRVPTGSRIAEEWCYTEAEYEARREANRDILRQDMEQMRQQQEQRRLAEEARRQAMRRGVSP